MAWRADLKGQPRLSLVSIPVEMRSATASEAKKPTPKLRKKAS